MPALRLKPHFAAHVVSPEEVALLGENGRYALRGKVYAAVVPVMISRAAVRPPLFFLSRVCVITASMDSANWARICAC